MPYKKNASAILEKMLQAKYPLIISHEKPDGDTLGSALSLIHLLEQNQRPYVYFCPDQPATYYNFLPKIEKISWDYKKINLNQHDLIIMIDCGDIKRTGMAEDILKVKDQILLINIDHHHSNNNFGHLNLVIPTASSTSEIIYNFLTFCHQPIDKYIATNLLTGIITDTMNFTNAGTTTESLKIASELLKIGARLPQITSNIMQNKDLAILNLWGKILDRLELNIEHNFAYTVIKKQDLTDSQIDAEAIDGMANFLSNLQEADFVLVLTEEENNVIKGSLRTVKNHIDVSKIAKIFNGGGHQKAAGFKTSLPESVTLDWKTSIINAIINELNNLNNKRNQEQKEL